MRIKDLITSRVCGNTVFENSWIWYCDECRQHGTAMSAEEADYMGTSHAEYFSYAEDSYNEETDEVLSFTDCPPEDRSKYVWASVCPVYIIDEGNNRTYELGEDYTDATPNQVTDIETMLKIQKQLGLE